MDSKYHFPRFHIRYIEAGVVSSQGILDTGNYRA